MELDVVLLSRIQFALTIMFHYLFPPLTIGLGVLMVIVEWLYLKTDDDSYRRMAHFWTKIFAVNFALGVATGLVMEFEFGLNWSRYSRFVGDVFGSALAAEGIFAFFLESGFLAVLVFGWDRVSKRMHFISTIMVCLGSIFSSVWIVIANSWQQTPAGFHLVRAAGGLMRAEITDFWAMVFNPSSMHRLTHVLIGCFILGAAFAMSVASYYLLRGRHVQFSRRTLTIALIYGAMAASAMIVSGDLQAKAVAHYQPAKLAALEGLYKTTSKGTPLILFAIPDDQNERLRFELGAKDLLSFLVHGSFEKPVAGLDKLAREDRPPVFIPFISYHLMVYFGFAFLVLTFAGLFFLWRGRLFTMRWLLWIYVFTVLGAYMANEAGWIAAEVGRQPWAVYGLLRTSEAASPVLRTESVIVSIALFALIYMFLFAVWVYVMNDKIQHGPDEEPGTRRESDTETSLLDAAGSLLYHGTHSLTATDRAVNQNEERSPEEAGE